MWTSALTDLALDNLDISDFGRWCKFGTYLKEHGEQGQITLLPPARSLLSKLQIIAFHDLILCLQRFPNCTVTKTVTDGVTCNGEYVVKWKNWFKYQGDMSNHRVKRFREKQVLQNALNVTTKRRGEETRREEKREEEKKNKDLPPTPLRGNSVSDKKKQKITDDEFFVEALKKSPAYEGINIEKELLKMDMWLLTPNGKGRKKTHKFILSWLNRAERNINTGLSRKDYNEGVGDDGKF